MTDLSGRIALVTGASRGLGAAVAKELARAGAHVILLARTVGALEEVDDEIQRAGGKATLIPADLQDLDALDALGPQLAEKFGKLDIFVANAAILGKLEPLPHKEAKEWQRVMDVNVNANFRLIRTLDPLLRDSDSGRAVFVSSGLGIRPKAYFGAYGTSKAALNMMVKIYAAETEKTNMRVNIVDPGVMRTDMRATAFPGEDPQTLTPPEKIAPRILPLLAPECKAHGDVIDLYKG